MEILLSIPSLLRPSRCMVVFPHSSILLRERVLFDGDRVIVFILLRGPENGGLGGPDLLTLVYISWALGQCDRRRVVVG